MYLSNLAIRYGKSKSRLIEIVDQRTKYVYKQVNLAIYVKDLLNYDQNRIITFKY